MGPTLYNPIGGAADGARHRHAGRRCSRATAARRLATSSAWSASAAPGQRLASQPLPHRQPRRLARARAGALPAHPPGGGARRLHWIVPLAVAHHAVPRVSPVLSLLLGRLGHALAHARAAHVRPDRARSIRASPAATTRRTRQLLERRRRPPVVPEPGVRRAALHRAASSSRRRACAVVHRRSQARRHSRRRSSSCGMLVSLRGIRAGRSCPARLARPKASSSSPTATTSTAASRTPRSATPKSPGLTLRVAAMNRAVDDAAAISSSTSRRCPIRELYKPPEVGRAAPERAVSAALRAPADRHRRALARRAATAFKRIGVIGEHKDEPAMLADFSAFVEQ